MASRRNLKKTIHTGVEEMLFDLSILHTVVSEGRKPAIEELISEVVGSGNDFTARISHTNDRNEARLIRKYYSKLQEEYLHFTNEIGGEVNKLGDELLAPKA